MCDGPGHVICDSHFGKDPVYENPALLALIQEWMESGDFVSDDPDDTEGLIEEYNEQVGSIRDEYPRQLCPVCNLSSISDEQILSYLVLERARLEDKTTEQIKTEAGERLAAEFTTDQELQKALKEAK
jgi:hypothetical protein